MPNVESLLQEWPPAVEALLRSAGLPPADLDVPLKDYADIVCGMCELRFTFRDGITGMLDIPVFKSRIQSLHVLFSLFGEMRTLQV